MMEDAACEEGDPSTKTFQRRLMDLGWIEMLLPCVFQIMESSVNGERESLRD